MMLSSKQDPVWLHVVLDWGWTWLLARTALVGLYLVSGLAKLLDFPAAIAEQEQFGLRPRGLWASLTMGVELIAPIDLAGSFCTERIDRNWLGKELTTTYRPV
jgi:hypothetical protein